MNRETRLIVKYTVVVIEILTAILLVYPVSDNLLLKTTAVILALLHAKVGTDRLARKA